MLDVRWRQTLSIYIAVLVVCRIRCINQFPEILSHIHVLVSVVMFYFCIQCHGLYVYKIKTTVASKIIGLYI